MNSMIVISRLVKSCVREAKGESGPSSSANSRLFHGDIFVIAHSVEVNTLVIIDNTTQSIMACVGLSGGCGDWPVSDADDWATLRADSIKNPVICEHT